MTVDHHYIDGAYLEDDSKVVKQGLIIYKRDAKAA